MSLRVFRIIMVDYGKRGVGNGIIGRKGGFRIHGTEIVNYFG
jgi:hypothetical protein